MKKIALLYFLLTQFVSLGQEIEYYRYSFDYFTSEVRKNDPTLTYFLKKNSEWEKVTITTLQNQNIDDATDWKIEKDIVKIKGFFSEEGVYKVSEDSTYEKLKETWKHKYYKPIWGIRVRELGLNLSYTTKSGNNIITSEKIFDIPENSAEFPGGEIKMNDFIYKSIKANVWHKYPKGAKVFVQFIISKKGEVGEILIVKGVNENIDMEVKLAISQMPNWIPARQKGKNVASRIILPIELK